MYNANTIQIQYNNLALVPIFVIHWLTTVLIKHYSRERDLVTITIKLYICIVFALYVITQHL
jgi:hypothetical protein